MKRYFLLWLLIGLVSAGSLHIRAQGKQSDFYAGGYPNAPIRMEVFSDYECPACRAFYLETVRNVLLDYSRVNKVAVIYHDFPLPVHQHSRQAARYGIAAQRLGKQQWLALTDGLYRQQPRWSIDGQIDVVAMQSLSPQDYARLKELLKDRSIDEALESEIAQGQARQVSSTPTSFLLISGHTQRFVGGLPYQLLRDYIDRILK